MCWLSVVAIPQWTWLRLPVASAILNISANTTDLKISSWDYMAHDVAGVAQRQGADVTLISRESSEIMPATKMEVEHVTREGVKIRARTVTRGSSCLTMMAGPRGVRVIKTDWSSGEMTTVEGTETEIECDLLVSAIGQRGDLSAALRNSIAAAD